MSAAVIADEVQGTQQKFQDWPSWLDHRVLDAVAPMTYTADAALFHRQLTSTLARARRGQVWVGIGAYRLSVPAIVGRIEEARAAGAAGVVVFSHESLVPAAGLELRARAFPARPAGAPVPATGPVPAGGPPR